MLIARAFVPARRDFILLSMSPMLLAATHSKLRLSVTFGTRQAVDLQ
jgi:hypothetical protein